MGRPKKSAVASRTNGALAKNKGKAKTKVPVLTVDYTGNRDEYIVSTEHRARLPKGYVAYESEVQTYFLGELEKRQVRIQTPEEKDDEVSRVRRRRADMEVAMDKALKMSVAAAGSSKQSKMAEMRKLAKGSKAKFHFKG